MGKAEIPFTVKTFVSSVKEKLELGRATLAWLVSAYQYCRDHFGEIRKADPTCTPEWLASQVFEVYHVSPRDLSIVVRDLGDNQPEKCERVVNLVERVGIEQVKKINRLPEPMKRRIMDNIPKNPTPKLVNAMIAEQKALVEKPEGKRRQRESRSSMAKLREMKTKAEKKLAGLQVEYNNLLVKYEQAMKKIREYEERDAKIVTFLKMDRQAVAEEG